MNQARHSVPGFLLRRNSGDFRASRPHAVGRHQGEQFVRRWRVERIGDDDPLFTLGRDLQNGRQLPRIPCQQDRLQMFIGFQQVIARVTALTQGAEVAAGHHHRIHRQRRGAGEGAGDRQRRTIVGNDFAHSRVEQLAVHALGLQRLQELNQILR